MSIDKRVLLIPINHNIQFIVSSYLEREERKFYRKQYNQVLGELDTLIQNANMTLVKIQDMFEDVMMEMFEDFTEIEKYYVSHFSAEL